MEFYKIGKGLKFVEVDDYENGCLPETAQHMQIDVEFSGDTPEEVIDELMNFYGVNEDDIQLNACDEAGRIDICKLENGDSYEPSEREKELWKQGEYTLYNAIYTHYISKVNENDHWL